jgi:hypothetical protein
MYFNYTVRLITCSIVRGGKCGISVAFETLCTCIVDSRTCILCYFMTGRYIRIKPIPVAARSKAWVSGCSLAWIAVSNPAGGIDVCVM